MCNKCDLGIKTLISWDRQVSEKPSDKGNKSLAKEMCYIWLKKGFSVELKSETIPP